MSVVPSSVMSIDFTSTEVLDAVTVIFSTGSLGLPAPVQLVSCVTCARVIPTCAVIGIAHANAAMSEVSNFVVMS